MCTKRREKKMTDGKERKREEIERQEEKKMTDEKKRKREEIERNRK